MGKSKKPFIDKKNSSTYHLLYRSQRDVAADGDEEGTGDAGVVLWPSPHNNKEMDQKVLLGGGPSIEEGGKETSTLNTWKKELAQAGLVDDYDYEKHMKPITGSGIFFDSSGKRGSSSLTDARGRDIRDDLVQEVERQLDSIALTADCMDDDIAQALFGDFDVADFEEINDDFVLDAAKEPEPSDEDAGAATFDFAAHIQSLMEKARMESEGTRQLATIHEQGKQDQEFFARAKALGVDEDEFDEFANLEVDGDVFGIELTPGVVPKLSEAEEKALCDKFEETLLEYDSDEIGEGVDCEEVLGPLPLEGDKQIEAALDDFLLEKEDEVFMTGTRHYMEHDDNGNIRGGSGFAALVGTKMIPAKELEESANVQGEMRPIKDVLGEADSILGAGRHAPPAEEIFIDGKSYFSEKMRNPWDCESILSTYSNLDNNPVTIGTGSRRRKKRNKKGGSGSSVATADDDYQQILLSEKTGLPLGILPTHGEEEDDDAGFDTYMSVNKGEARNKKETKEEKKLRKLNIKKERQMARMQKKMMKEAFTDEFAKRQQEVMVDDAGGKTIFRF